MKTSAFALKGTLIHTPDAQRFVIMDDGYLVCEDGLVKGTFEKLPDKYQGISVHDYTGQLIIPGMADIHQHAPQYGFRGLGLDLDLDSVWNTWFETYSFPEESHFADLEYADKAYDKFLDDLLRSTTTRISTYATIHRPATELLMEKLDKRGFAAYVGKLNMDRNSIEGLLETTEESLAETRKWLENTAGKFLAVKPMVTPRYTPSCTDACMEGLQKLVEEFHVPVQSHLSEGLDEIEWVKELKPEIEFYGQAYDMYGMFGGDVPAVMAHCVYPTEAEFDLMTRRKNLWVAHCPQSNLHSSGSAAPIRRYMEAGVHVGIGSDMAGANTLNLLRAIADATIASKVYWACNERKGDSHAERTYLSLSEAFYIATKGGASLWGKAGSFEEDYLFDAVVIDDTALQDFNHRSPRMRIERAIQRADDRHIAAKYINGTKVL